MYHRCSPLRDVLISVREITSLVACYQKPAYAICANAEFWFNHTVVEEVGHRNTKGKKNLTTNKVTEGLALESEHMRAEQGLQHGNSHGKEEFKDQPVEFWLCIAGWAPSPPG